MERRFFVEKIGQQAILAGDEFSHAKNVLRLGVGDELVRQARDGVQRAGRKNFR